LRKTKALQAFSVVNFNSTFYGGGLAESLSGMTLLMNSAGIKAEWRVIQGRPDFFYITKKMQHALQGADINLSEIKTTIFEEVNFENAASPTVLLRWPVLQSRWLWRKARRYQCASW
jgi:trehalose synthase